MGKCQDCGFMYGEDKNGNMVEISHEVRKTGDLSGKQFAHAFPICYHDVYNFKELSQKEGVEGRANQILRVIIKYGCDEYAEYIKGYSPTKLREMKISEQRQMYEDKLSAKNRTIAIVGIVLTVVIPVITFFVRWLIVGSP